MLLILAYYFFWAGNQKVAGSNLTIAPLNHSVNHLTPDCSSALEVTFEKSNITEVTQKYLGLNLRFVDLN